MQKIIYALATCLLPVFLCAQENATVRQLGVNTFGSQVVNINNYAPVGSLGNNMWIGDGGQSSSYTGGITSSYNTAVGMGALLNNTMGSYNVGLGAQTLRSNTTGISNVAIGAFALLSNTIGNDNVALGASTLMDNNTGEKNLGIVGGALRFNTSGSYNSAIGVQAMYSNTTGNHNFALGAFSLYFKQTGSQNIGIGNSALAGSSNSSYDSNIAIGYQAMQNHQAGNNNTSIGTFAGKSYGLSATLADNISNSVLIGYDSRAGGNNQSNQIVIGYQSIGNGSNTTTIGNSSTQHTVFQYGKTLVGYSAAQDRGNYALQVNGQIYATNSTIATSDARLKERVEPLWSGLKEVMALRPCTFSFKQGSGQNLATGRQVGFIAQEVASVVEDEAWAQSVVQEAGGNLGIAETKLLPLLVKAMQEQQAQIESLNARLLLLQSQISKREEKAERTKYSAKKVALRK